MNTLYPGRPDYTGPTVGLFGLLHHDLLCEWSWDINRRIEWVKVYKDDADIRLCQMVYLPPEQLPEKIRIACNHLIAIGTENVLRETVETQIIVASLRWHRITQLIDKLVPDNTWDGQELRLKGRLWIYKNPILRRIARLFTKEKSPYA